MLTAGPQIPQIWLLSWKSQEKHKKRTGYGVIKQYFKFVYDIEAQENGKNAEKEVESDDDNGENSSFCTILVK